jgi:hypothetical protein
MTVLAVVGLVGVLLLNLILSPRGRGRRVVRR